jgi:NAD(P)-dependent dehydrogenase (short-subunit alcohol dehydrogenase family)
MAARLFAAAVSSDAHRRCPSLARSLRAGALATTLGCLGAGKRSNHPQVCRLFFIMRVGVLARGVISCDELRVREPKDKVIVITGAASGIGRALALHAATLGMHVVLADIEPARLAQTVAEVDALGAQALGVEVDVGDIASVVRLADAAYARFGAVHVLVNNAGIAAAGAAWKVPLDTWERCLRINLDGVVYGVHTFVPRMLDGDEPGHVVNVASAAGLITVPGFAPYSASKFAVVGLTEALYHDLKLRNSKVSASLLCPSWVQTRIAKDSVAATSDVDAIDATVEKAVARAVENGISAEQVAREVFDAIANDRFYILTHADTRKAFALRSEDILQNRQPTLPSFERRPSTPAV